MMERYDENQGYVGIKISPKLGDIFIKNELVHRMRKGFEGLLEDCYKKKVLENLTNSNEYTCLVR